MEDSLRNLDTAIQARIAKEDLFIQRITQEFARISADMRQTASDHPQVNLNDFIHRIDTATAKLNQRPSFGTGDDLDQLVRRVKGNSTNTPNTPMNTPMNTRPMTELQRLQHGYYETPEDGNDASQQTMGGKRYGGWTSIRKRRTPRKRRTTRMTKPF